MATSSASSAGRQNSRFSSLNVFKIASTSSKAPQPPPKDTFYLPNPSLVSLTQSVAQDLSSNPLTPISSRYAASARSPSPSPSYSTSQYALSTTVVSPSAASNTLSPESAGSRKGLFKLPSFTRRSKTPKVSKPIPQEPPEPADDPSISLPWNFQHNIHVDEGYAGLPPTWSASLADLGFSPDEITIINARRAAARSPTLTPLYGQSFHLRTDSTTSSGLSHFKPRSSSLQRDFSDDGLSQRSQSIRPSIHSREDSESSRRLPESSSDSRYDQVVYVRPTPRSPETPTLRSRSGSAGTPPAASSPALRSVPSSPALIRSPHGVMETSPPRSPLTTPLAGNGQTPGSPLSQGATSRVHTPSPPSNSSGSTPSDKDRPPRTPPRRFHVVNTSITTIPSPPPAYKSPTRAGPLLDNTGIDSSHRAETTQRDTDNDGSDSEDLAALPSTGSRLPTIPPRLSLHQDDLADLSSWTESLFSIIPGSDKSSSPPRVTAQPYLTRTASPSVSSQPSASSSSSPKARHILHSSNNLRSSPAAVSRHLPAQKPAPLHHLPPREDTQSLSAPTPTSVHDGSLETPYTEERTTPLFNEVMNMVNPHKGNGFEELQVKSLYREKENRDSSMSTMTVTPATIVRDVAVATRARANVIHSPIRDNDDVKSSAYSQSTSPLSPESDDSDDSMGDRSNSPSSSESHSSGTSAAVSLSTSTTGSASVAISQGSLPYIESSPLPSPLAGSFGQSALSSASIRQYRDTNPAGPSIVIQDIDKVNAMEESRIPSPYSTSATTSPSSPCPQYPGWVSEVVAPIREFITERVNPRSLFTDLQEIAEGESGSVYAARVVHPSDKGKDLVAIKHVTLVPSGTPKLVDLEQELTVLKSIAHPHILCMDALYIDLDEDALWIRMELMDRSLADIIALADDGVMLQEKQMALVAKDILSALDHLRKLGIAHRDVRSDNLLVNPEGHVMLADFSNAVQVPILEPTRSDPAGVHYWQAPEMRCGPYNTLKVDVWSLGATVWEMAQREPPFSDATDLSQLADRWPALSQPEVYSRSFHDFLHLCSEPSISRPDPHDLLNTPFIRNSGDRFTLLQILSQCKSIEMSPRRQSTDSHETVS